MNRFSLEVPHSGMGRLNYIYHQNVHVTCSRMNRFGFEDERKVFSFGRKKYLIAKNQQNCLKNPTQSTQLHSNIQEAAWIDHYCKWWEGFFSGLDLERRTWKPKRKANSMFTTLSSSKELVIQFLHLSRRNSQCWQKACGDTTFHSEISMTQTDTHTHTVHVFKWLTI